MRSAIVVVVIFASFQSLECLNGIQNSRLNYFDIDLLRYSAEDKSGNVMVSPASIKSTLAMLLEGARGATAAEIRTALRLTPNKEDFREELSLFLKSLEVNSPNVILQNANALFVSKKLNLKAEYEMMARRVYFSDVNRLDFNDPKTAADNINAWVNGKTRGLIPSIIEQVHISPLTELLVTNALYFKSTWKHAFEPSSTHCDCFYKAGVCNNVAMMDLQAQLNYAYVENLRAHALELPYQGEHYSMILLVPQDRDAGIAVIRDLPYIGLLEISRLMEPTEVILTMPKFTVEYSVDVVPALKNMRITSLFTPSANLSGIFDNTSAYLTSIYHTVYMSVDEKGTVAAAASAGMVVPLINDQVQLRVDRPFLFFIRDNKKGLVLFEGKIEEPTAFVTVHTKSGLNQFQNQPSQPIPTLTQPNQIQPISTLSQTNQNQPGSSQTNPSQSMPGQPEPMPIQPIVSRPDSSQPTTSRPSSSQPSSSQPSSSQPITEHARTIPPSRKSEDSWFKKLTGILG